MNKDLFRAIYNSPYIRETDYEQIARAHTGLEVQQGKILLEEGKTAREYYVVEHGLFRSFVCDYMR